MELSNLCTHDELKNRRWLAVVKDDVVAEVGRIAERKRLRKLNNEGKTTSVTTKSEESCMSVIRGSFVSVRGD